MIHPTVESLQKETNRRQEDVDLVTTYAPLIQFDNHEPFFPKAVGYTIFHSDASSSSFPREVTLTSDQYEAAVAIEYAVWWDWDIEHLYELEHVWVYVDNQGQICHAEASWHGGFHEMTYDDKIPMQNNQLIIFSEPGKHAFAPDQSWFEKRLVKTLNSCRMPGRGGVWVTPLFEGIIQTKSEKNDALVQQYLQQYSFEPAFEFSQTFSFTQDMMIPWPALFDWIPQRVAWCLQSIADEQT